MVRVATFQQALHFAETWDAHAAQLEQWVGEAAACGAQIALFPEYSGLGLASLCDPTTRADAHRYLPAIQPFVSAYCDLHAALARKYQLYLLAGSLPVRTAHGAFRNRAYFFRPDGSHDFQDKLIMTRVESEVWCIEPGREVKVFETAYGCVGVAICYDVEFPWIARLQAEAGVRLLLAPSWTESLAGHHRVKVGCRARAMENQIYVALAAITGSSPWLASCELGIGAGGVFTPPDRGFPPDGILAERELNAPGWLVADLDLTLLETARCDGQVLNYRDWAFQHGLTVTTVPEGSWFVPALISSAGHGLCDGTPAESPGSVRVPVERASHIEMQHATAGVRINHPNARPQAQPPDAEAAPSPADATSG